MQISETPHARCMGISFKLDILEEPQDMLVERVVHSS